MNMSMVTIKSIGTAKVKLRSVLTNNWYCGDHHLRMKKLQLKFMNLSMSKYDWYYIIIATNLGCLRKTNDYRGAIIRICKRITTQNHTIHWMKSFRYAYFTEFILTFIALLLQQLNLDAFLKRM